MTKPESVEKTLVQYELTITDGRVLVNGKQYKDLDPDGQAFFNLSLNVYRNKQEQSKIIHLRDYKVNYTGCMTLENSNKNKSYATRN